MGKLAARKTDAVAHIKGGGPVIEGCETVLIGGLPAARLADKVQHNKGIEPIVAGENTVLIGGKPAARIGDKVGCGGRIAQGCPTVIIGKDDAAECLAEAAKSGDAIVTGSLPE